MRCAVIGLAVLWSSVVCAQGTPGGTYRAPADDLAAMSSYSTEPNARYEMQIRWPVAYKDKDGKDRDRTASKSYFVMGGQLYGFKKNLKEFCKKEKLQVEDCQPGSITVITLQRIPPPPKIKEPELDYIKGTGTNTQAKNR